MLEPMNFNPDSKKLANKILFKALELSDIIDDIESCRELSLSKTKLEECVMWANKAIAIQQLNKEDKGE